VFLCAAGRAPRHDDGDDGGEWTLDRPLAAHAAHAPEKSVPAQRQHAAAAAASALHSRCPSARLAPVLLRVDKLIKSNDFPPDSRSKNSPKRTSCASAFQSNFPRDLSANPVTNFSEK
jgi:hypothetical protein